MTRRWFSAALGVLLLAAPAVTRAEAPTPPDTQAHPSRPASAAVLVKRVALVTVPGGFERGRSAAGVRGPASGVATRPRQSLPHTPVPSQSASTVDTASAPAAVQSVPSPVTESDTPLTLLPLLPPGMNETVVRVPVGTTGKTLETTVFKPEGSGPFPVVVFNHGKEPIDPREQLRARPLAFAREFVRRGYLVVVPNREGFAGSDGTYTETPCDITGIGEQQAVDVAATVDWLHTQPDADTSRVLVAGASQGGLATIAYGMHPATGVRGLINFSGGLRQALCDSWQQSLVAAFTHFGTRAPLPSLWLYGDNDQNWPIDLARRLRDGYRDSGGQVAFVDFGAYKDNAHRLVGDRDGVAIWWPAVDRFLVSIGMPDTVCERTPAVHRPAPSHFAALDDVDAVPYLDEEGRNGYRTFLTRYPSRAFAISSVGAWSWAEGGDDPIAVALDNCQRNSETRCQLYAIDDAVVWHSPNERSEHH
ncbi:dienelactone hydrolase family protein [Robbsia andropogonis]|uniref:dienelactone hydrolase family protein n=1 Tax=Robbsia andropogonis TaxID=28092 RepID=UPI000696F0A8|nr:CocE/NonD family hydrolase [Robbsia andropogonis]